MRTQSPDGWQDLKLRPQQATPREPPLVNWRRVTELFQIIYAARRPADPVYLYPSDHVRYRMKDGIPLQRASCAPEGR